MPLGISSSAGLGLRSRSHDDAGCAVSGLQGRAIPKRQSGRGAKSVPSCTARSSLVVKEFSAEGKLEVVDPDLRPDWQLSQYRLVASVVLKFGADLLTRQDADRLAAVPSRLATTTYTVTLATLLPEQSREILHRAIEQETGEYKAGERGQLAAALLGLGGEGELRFVRDFFYTEPLTPAYGPESQRSLISGLEMKDQPIYERVLGDERGKELSPGLMARSLEKFPRLSHELLREWFFALRKDPGHAGDSVEYF